MKTLTSRAHHDLSIGAVSKPLKSNFIEELDGYYSPTTRERAPVFLSNSSKLVGNTA